MPARLGRYLTQSGAFPGPAPLCKEDARSVEEGTAQLNTRTRLFLWIGVAIGVIASFYFDWPM